MNFLFDDLKYAVLKNLMLSTVYRETILMRVAPNITGMASKVTMQPGMTRDVISLRLLQSTGGLKDRTPVTASGNGNCLFNSLSTALVGDESLNMELRLRTLRWWTI